MDCSKQLVQPPAFDAFDDLVRAKHEWTRTPAQQDRGLILGDELLS
jgi:hypothetical protein